jgi:hypothetical protein
LNLPILAGVPNVPVEKERRIAGITPLRLSHSEAAHKFSLKTADHKIRDVILDPLAPAGVPYGLMLAKLSLMQRERGVKTILITSAAPNEGKTFASCCLAGVLARDPGKRVLLIDVCTTCLPKPAPVHRSRTGRDRLLNSFSICRNW